MVMDSARLVWLAGQSAADLIEVFSSIQGEGPRVGERHLFVRTVHCDIHCAYCDTPLCHAPRSAAMIERVWGAGDRQSVENPVGLDRLSHILAEALATLPHAAVSFTGGEPLLQPWIPAALSPTVRAAGAAVLLETDGNLPDAFAEIVSSIDVLSMDWKLPSATGEVERAAEHRRMLATAEAAGLEMYVKAVFIEETPESELEPLIAAVREIDPEIPVVLQPCTPFRRVRKAPSRERGLALHGFVSSRLPRVRLLPQIHPMMEMP